MSWRRNGNHPDSVAGHESRLGRFAVLALQDWQRRNRVGYGHSSAGTSLKFLVRHDSPLDQQGRDARQHAFVIAGPQVPARLHALDGMPIGVSLVGPQLGGRQDEQRPCQPFPRVMKDRLVRLAHDLAEAGLSAKIVGTNH